MKSHGRVSKNALDLTRQIAQHRKFYLSRSSSLSLGSNASKNGIKKSRKPRADLAVFVEKAANNLTPRAATTALLGPDNASKCMVDYLQIDEERKQSNPRKLPRASAAEKLWRNKSWIKKTNGISSDGKSEVLSKHPKENPNAWDCESVALAEQLHRIALLETQNVPANAKDDASTARRPKVYPKPPKARPENQSHIDQTDHQDDAPDDRTMLKSTSSGSESNYIYDTYLRVSEVDLITPPMHGIQDAENGKVGILIIEEQDEVTWQTFGEGEDESDKDWNSEEEDENGAFKIAQTKGDFSDPVKAEDFYGNDYPEDEVSSSDEFDKGAYHYRVHQSDDEEYDTNDGDLRYYDINVPCPLEKRFRSTRISRFDDEDGPESD